MVDREVREALMQVAREYPHDLVAGQIQDVERVAFNIGLVLRAAQPTPRHELQVCDLGGGIGLFSVTCRALGMKRFVLVDDFDDPVNRRVGDGVLALHRRYGVEVLARDVIGTGIGDIAGTFDAITSFDSMEHWHRSPKKLFHEVVGKLVKGGVFILGVPNCVNLRKRISVPLGRGTWSRLEDWYEQETFRGHVREPGLADLRYIARDMGLRVVDILGRNWAGHFSPHAAIRVVTRFVDLPLRLRPQLCSDLYMIARKV